MEVNPLSIILVKSDSKGDRLLFRYPYRPLENNEPLDTKRRNPYALMNTEDLLQSPPPPYISNISKNNYLTGFSDEVLSTLFAVKPELCNRKFELKVNDVRFVGHPTLLTNQQEDTTTSTNLLIHIVFALRALASHSIVKCYYELSKLLGTALKHEEHRCGYVSEQNRLMAGTHDDGTTTTSTSDSNNAFNLILLKSTLATNLKQVYEHLYNTGFIKIQINGWIPINYCLPQKVHNNIKIEPSNINNVIKLLRPYHGLLLLHTQTQLIDLISLDGSPTLVRLLKMYSPVKSLQTLAADSDLTLSHVYELTSHLVYWGKATIIYPLCSTNKYVISRNASIEIHLNSPLVELFYDSFPDKNLLEVISEFSLPTSLSHKTNPFAQQSQLVQMMVWMLQHHLLTQLHTYILFLPRSSSNDEHIYHDLSINNIIDTNSYSPRKTNLKQLQFNLEQQKQHLDDTTTTTTTRISSRSNVQSRTESESGTSTISDDLFIDVLSSPNNNNNNDDNTSLVLSIDDSHRGGQKQVNNITISSTTTDHDEQHQHQHQHHHHHHHKQQQHIGDDSLSTSSSYHEQLLDFTVHERDAILKIPAASNTEDLVLLAKLCRKGYFRGEHHLEEIMYLENLRRSQLLQLLDKFRDILITYETEDPAISMHDY